MKVIVWHNPKCSSSRKALAYLAERGIEPEIYLYLQEGPSKAKIKDVLKLSGLKASQLLRPKEAIGQELGLYEGAKEADILDAMAEHPILIQRPIVITPKGAAIARPIEAIEPLL